MQKCRDNVKMTKMHRPGIEPGASRIGTRPLSGVKERSHMATANFTTKPPMLGACDLTRGRTWNLLIAERVVVKRLAIGPLGQRISGVAG